MTEKQQQKTECCIDGKDRHQKQTERGCNMKTEVTELLGIEYPIIQGGMAWVAEYHLAAGVSNAGAFHLAS